ncbi:hypothetical protein LTS18_011568 [Coniosporium uncinatum]|uniref:Uncharacterized protein n=1 Tax=Coniosporium uncinatum TaxID=93489 RepID=A0ACC3CYG1_9PEZI|nr:hypothetical protein LTS18_011568 [Coniosporium uncinatum]
MQSVQAERLRSLEFQVKTLEKTYQDNQAPFDLRLTAIEESFRMRPSSDLPSPTFDGHMPPPSKIPAKKITANPVHEVGIERAPPSVYAQKLSSSELNDLTETDKMTPSLSKNAGKSDPKNGTRAVRTARESQTLPSSASACLEPEKDSTPVRIANHALRQMTDASSPGTLRGDSVVAADPQNSKISMNVPTLACAISASMSSEMLIDGTSMDIDEQDVFRNEVASATSAGQQLAEVSAGQRTHYLYEWKSHCKEHRGDPIELDDFIRREVAKLGSTDTKRRASRAVPQSQGRTRSVDEHDNTFTTTGTVQSSSDVVDINGYDPKPHNKKRVRRQNKEDDSQVDSIQNNNSFSPPSKKTKRTTTRAQFSSETNGDAGIPGPRRSGRQAEKPAWMKTGEFVDMSNPNLPFGSGSKETLASNGEDLDLDRTDEVTAREPEVATKTAKRVSFFEPVDDALTSPTSTKTASNELLKQFKSRKQ